MLDKVQDTTESATMFNPSDQTLEVIRKCVAFALQYHYNPTVNDGYGYVVDACDVQEMLAEEAKHASDQIQGHIQDSLDNQQRYQLMRDQIMKDMEGV